MTRQRTKTTVKPEDLKSYALLQFAEGFTRFFSVLPKYAFLVFLVYHLRYAIKELAGKETLALIKAGISYDTGCGSVSWISAVLLIICIFGIGYGLIQRWMRSKQIQMYTAHVQQLERLIDKKRSSSNLTSKGNTNPRDK